MKPENKPPKPPKWPKGMTAKVVGRQSDEQLIKVFWMLLEHRCQRLGYDKVIEELADDPDPDYPAAGSGRVRRPRQRGAAGERALDQDA
jgi:hypothetical protein